MGGFVIVSSPHLQNITTVDAERTIKECVIFYIDKIVFTVDATEVIFVFDLIPSYAASLPGDSRARAELRRPG